MLHRSIMLHAEDRIHVLITRLRESAAPPERQALLDELTEIEASVHEVAHSVVDYQHVMDELDDNILVADKDEVVLYVNDAYIRHTGIAPEQILGKRITELLETGTYFTDPTCLLYTSGQSWKGPASPLRRQRSYCAAFASTFA